MKEKWIEEMRQKLADYEVEPPAGLWEDICKEMGISPEPVSKPSKWRYWAAAAVVLALVGFFLFQKQPESMEQTALLEEKQTTDEQTQTPPLATDQEEGTEQVAEVHENRPVRTGMRRERVAEVVAERTEEALVTPNDTASQPIENHAVQQPKENKTITPQTKEHTLVASHGNDVIKRHVVGSGSWSLGLNASGGLLAANNTTYTAALYQNMADNINNVVSQYNAPDSYTLTDYIWKHRLPVRFGLSLQYQLNDNVALLSGISYTRLSSEFAIPLYPKISYDQTLHYLGVPLGVSWKLWSDRHFSFYLSGNAMMEKCLSSSFSMEHDRPLEKPWQLSVSAAAGAEYTLTRQLGVYVQPSLGYYFDDGSSLEHYYKEHPLALNIEFGLRLHLQK